MAEVRITTTTFSSESVLKLGEEEALNLFYADKSAWRFETADGRVLFVVTRNRDLRAAGYAEREAEARRIALSRLSDGANGEITEMEPRP